MLNRWTEAYCSPSTVLRPRGIAGAETLPNQVWLLATQKSKSEREMLVERKVAFSPNVGNLGRQWV